MSIVWMKQDSRRASITIDKQRRIYLSTEARKLLGLTADYRLIVGFDKANQRVIVAKPEVVRVPDVQSFKFDSRHYTHARRMVRELGFTDAELPLQFEYVGRDYADYVEGAYAFERVGFDAPDK